MLNIFTRSPSRWSISLLPSLLSHSLSLFFFILSFHSLLPNFSFSSSLSFSHVYAVCSRNPKNVRRSWTEHTHTHVQSCTAQLGNCTAQKSLVPFLHLQSEQTQHILSGFSKSRYEGDFIPRKRHSVESLFHVHSRDYAYAVCVRR